MSIESDRTAPLPQASPASELLAWYERHRRVLPWRQRRGRPDPYKVWLSEIMLQQTTVKTVLPYFADFLARWPRVADLAAADRDDVLRAWAGLGYYARARNLHACAQAVMREHGGKFPSSEAGLRTLPGIGVYTAAAIAAIAFGERTAPVDGNIERVIARLAAIETPLPAAKDDIRETMRPLVPEDRPGDFAQALMDLGAMICTPKKPACGLCPWEVRCAARAAGIAETLPRKAGKRAPGTRFAIAYVLEDETGAVLLRRRPDKGLLGGMLEVPSSDWSEKPPSARAAPPADLKAFKWKRLDGTVAHTFTHFRLELIVAHALCGKAKRPEGIWTARAALRGEALPTLMRKILAHALER
ncbi:MAG: A/G-specific adenine glycosylase [Alphaproteobacteria bacterium]|nr:A/G-specific adenine glycosylase [Alphaproteobacteria bacterium]